MKYVSMMWKRIVYISALLISLFVPANALGQAFDPWGNEHPEREIYAIEKNWSETPLKVGNDFPKAMIRNFAKAFCSQYRKYAPNVAVTLYLKNPGHNKVEEDNYYMLDDPRNGYIKCDMLGQYDYLTEMCYWKRANGHSLVGVLLQMGHEGEGVYDDSALLFYDYNPSTRTMTPDMTVYQTVKDILAKHTGTPTFRLPKEGKDIKVIYVESVKTDGNDFKWEENMLKWGNDAFTEIQGETVYF